jgi:hypothetical protein
VTQDTNLPEGHALREQRLDETETGEGTAVMLLDGRRPAERVRTVTPRQVAARLGASTDAAGLVSGMSTMR